MTTSPTSPGGDSRSTNLPPTLHRKARRLGIYGARGTGKTCYLACLYGHRATDIAAVTFGDDPSIDHLQSLWKDLKRGEVPAATALTLPTELALGLQADGLAWETPTRDYAGALVQRSETGVPELKTEVKEWLGACHAILLFVNCDADDDALKDRHDELDLLVTELKRLSPDGNTISRPIALLLTKWDIQGPISRDAANERQRAFKYLDSRPSLRQIADSLRNCGDRVELFPVSAFGSNRDTTKPPADGPRPFGLHEPLIWAVRKADEMLLERAKRDAYQCAGTHLWWWQRRYGKAVACYRGLEKQHGINKGPTHAQALLELSSWRRKLYQRRAWVGAVLLAFVALVSTFGLLWEERTSRDRALAALNDTAMPPEEVARACERHQNSMNPMTRWLGTRDDVAREWESYRTGREGRDFAALEEYRKTNAGAGEAEARCERCREFLTRWPGSARAATVKSWEADDERRSESHRADLRFDEEHRRLLATLHGLGDNWDKAVAACNVFLGQFPEAKYPNRVKQRKEVEQILAANEKAKSERDWAVVVNYERQNPSNFDEIMRQARDYANKPNPAYRKEAQELIERTESRWDRTEYEKVRIAAREVKDSHSVQAAEQAARRYLVGTHPLKRCEEDVKRWLKWCDGLKEDRDYYIEVKSLSIPKGSALAEATVTEDVRVHVQINDTKHTTDWYRGRNPQIGGQLGPYRLKWGQAATLHVEVEEYDWIGPGSWNDRATGETTDQRFVLMRANGAFETTCSKNNAVTVYLECPAVVPPSLRPYPER